MTNPGNVAPAVSEIPPELQFSSTPLPEYAEREPLFSIDGKVYSMPKKIPAGVALRALEEVAARGEIAGAAVLFKEVVGPDAYEALRDCKGIDEDGFAAILRIVQDKAMGQLDKLKGE
ncbi:MAG TPA: hypothetical protein VFO67_05120 [Gemmatimonadales bacterium]|nr:hypothetical protein [Gemmatimonadales bacterium]